MSVRLLSVQEVEDQLKSRNCKFIKALSNGYSIWEDHNAEPFSLPPPEEDSDGRKFYADHEIYDMIEQLNLGPAGPACH